MAAAVALAPSPSEVSARVEEMVRMAHSGDLPPSLAAFKQQLLDECDRVAAGGDDHELRMVLAGPGGPARNGLSLGISRVPSAGTRIQECYQLTPWDRVWDNVREWEWGDVLQVVGGAEEKVTSVCLLLALLPSLHPRLTYLDINSLSKVEVMGGRGEWVAQAVDVLCAAMLSLSRQSANMITHLQLVPEPFYQRRGGDDCMEKGSVHLSHLLRSTHCNLLSLSLRGYEDDLPIEVEGGGGELTPLGHIAQALQVNTTLTTLRIALCPMCTATAHEIAALLSVNTILQRVQFLGVGITKEGATYLRRSLCGAQSGTTSKAPTIPFGSGALTALELFQTYLGEEGTSWVPWLGDMLAHNVSLQTLDLSDSGLRDGAGRDVAKGLRQSSSSLKVLNITDNVDLSARDMQHIFSALENHATLQEFQCGTSFPSWSQGAEEVEDMARALARMISTNRSLRALRYPLAPFSATQWSEHIVPALLANGTLKVIDFQGCKGISGVQVFQGLLHLIRTHIMILDLRLDETPLYESGQAQAILEELQQVKNFWKTLSALPTSKPTSARIILCGREYAGKSTLRRTIQHLLNTGSTSLCHMLKLAAQKSKRLFKLQSPHEKEVRERTRGIDIQYLDEIGGTRFHVWDLAGHREFHALYDFMLCSNRNAATLFVFTYSPIISPMEIGAGRLKLIDQFKHELRYWLQFVASKSEPHVKPQVVVAITNKDRVLAYFNKRPREYRDWELGVKNTIVNVAREEFYHVIHLHQQPLIVNLRSKSRQEHALVRNWMDINIKTLQETLSSVERVPAICDAVGRAMSLSQTCPLITKQEFFSICAQELQKTVHTSEERIVKLLTGAVAVCLHHSGEVIYDKDLHFIVRNPRWFGFGILGHLLDLFGQDVGADRTNHLPKDGFMTKETLRDLLHQASQKVPGVGDQRVDADLLVDDLIKLMIRLHLCYEQRPNNSDNTGYFIPATFNDKDQKATNGMRSWEWVTPMKKGSDKIIGKRLQCASPTTTFLTDGFFPRVQVMLYYLCINEKWVHNSEDTSILTMEKNFFRICADGAGMEIVVEFSGHCGYFIDIMVKSSHRSHREMNKFVDRYFLGNIRALCASQQGCQGVALEEAVIRPACLQRECPVVCAHRRDQATPIQLLKERVDGNPDHLHRWGEVIGEGGRVIVRGDFELGSALLHGDTSNSTEGPSPPAQDLGSPRHIYVTKEDVRWTRKLVVKARRGRVVPFRFHLQCECKDQEHVVDGQGGRIFYVVDNDFAAEERLRVGIGKVAAAVLKGANNLLPGANALASLPLYDGTPVYCDTIEDLGGGTSQFRRPGATLLDEELRQQVEKEMRNSRKGPWMNAFLSFGPSLKEVEEFREDFLVREVEYIVSSSSYTRAWMCEQHCRDGVDQGILRKVI